MHPDLQFSTWLLRPYLDLGPARTGPLHARNVTECWRSFSLPASERYVPQRAMPPGFRGELLRVVGDSRYAVGDPRGLPQELHTPAWSGMCDAIGAWPGLPTGQQVRLLILLHTLGFYQLATKLPLPGEPGAWRHDAGLAELHSWAASARVMLNMPAPSNDFQPPELATFERLAVEGPRGSVVRFDSAIKVLVGRAKAKRSGGGLQEWASVLQATFQDLEGSPSQFQRGLLTSRYYRALGFVPQYAGEREELVRIMDLAEQHAVQLVASNPSEEILRSENLHAVLESRTKEALWLGDQAAALNRARRVVDVDPCDSKALVELGHEHLRHQEWRLASHAFVTAATMGPPASAIGRHMAALCFRRLGEEALAALLFTDALEADPEGMSPRDEMSSLESDDRTELLKQWSRETYPI